MVTLLNIDCMEYMATVPDKYFDLAIVDPPYGINIAKSDRDKNHVLSELLKRMNEILNPLEEVPFYSNIYVPKPENHPF